MTFAILLMAGCAEPPVLVAHYRCGLPANVIEAPTSGTYTLYGDHERTIKSSRGP
jgi:hypothetical protein